MLERDLDNDLEFLRWHNELCREDARRHYRDHLRYEYVRRLSVRQFDAIYTRALGPETFDEIIDACLAGCTPDCHETDYPGCAHCMLPKRELSGNSGELSEFFVNPPVV